MFGSLRLTSGLAKNRTDHRSENQRVEQTTGQHGEYSDRQKTHELAGDAGPKHQRQESGQGCSDRRSNGPEHALGGHDVGPVTVIAFGHFAIGVLGNHDGPVDEHAKAKQHAEHDHEVEGVAQQIKKDQRKQER